MESRPLLPQSTSHSRSNSQDIPRRRRRAPPVYAYPAILTVTLFVFASIAALGLSSCSPSWVCRALGDEPLTWKRNSGPYAPFDPGSVPRLPPGCAVDQATVLHRHTDRFPTTAHGDRLRVTLGKIANRTGGNRRELAFLDRTDLEMKDWEFDTLTDRGRRAAWESGAALARYPMELFTRASGSQRVVETAGLVVQGYWGEEYDPSATPELDVVIPEGETVNNTLSVHNCPKFRRMDPPAGHKEWAKLLPFLEDGVERLNRLIQPIPRFEAEDIVHIAQMCGFDTARTGWSPWCRVLAAREWDVVGYLTDVERWYRVGAGGRYGKIMGSGWVNELIARITDSEVVDETCTNRTLDSDPATFPQGGERLFIDFTHDNEMIEIMTAMGMRKIRVKLPTDHVPLPDSRERERLRLCELIPFGARWVFERVKCKGKTKYVRVLVNDRPVRIDHMACRSSKMYEHSMCDVSAFVESQAWAREEVDWTDCL